MLTLYFSKPLAYKELKNAAGYKFPGIYIWGFKRGKNFIPHYVGKHEKNIQSRIISHFLGITQTNKYALFTSNFYENLHETHGMIKRVAQPYRKRFYQEEKNEDCLLRFEQKWTNKITGPEDWKLLQTNFFNENDFYISCAETPSTCMSKQLTLCETAVKFSLKYNVISRSQSFEVLKNDGSIIITSQNDCLEECFCKCDDKSNPPEAFKCWYQPVAT